VPLFLLLTALFQDLGVGRWEFDEEASHYESSAGPRFSEREFRYTNFQTHFLHRGITRDDQTFFTEFQALMDGPPGAVQGSGLYDSVSLHRESPWVINQIFRKGTEVTVRARRQVSPDGQTLRIEACGPAFMNVLIYRRIPVSALRSAQNDH
jgi:hypothetical protein